jgi:hypothetical protein
MKQLVVLGQTLDVKMSHSFKNNAACPLYLKLHYKDKVDERFVRVAAERGKGLHSTLAALITICNEADIQPDELAVEQIQEAVVTHTPQNVVSEMPLILDWTKMWAEKWKISPHYFGHEEMLAVDSDFDECEFSEGSYRGILDVIDINGTHCTVTDWKSQPHILAQGDLDDALGYGVPEQLTGYAWLAHKYYPYLETFSVRIFYNRYAFYHESDRTLEDLDNYQELLLMNEQKISEIDSWDPIPGKHCQYCDFIHMCPLSLDTSNPEGSIISEETGVRSYSQAEAVQIARRVHVMDELSKSFKGKLKDYVNANDNVRIGDGFGYGFSKSESRTWPVDKAEEVLENHDRKLSEVANVDSRRMQKLLKEASRDNPDLCEELYEIEKPKHSTRFGGYQITPESE